tara:strand:- start:208 stop:378 length:171 start_codon:yes stop_codon:yes gene_type:complete
MYISTFVRGTDHCKQGARVPFRSAFVRVAKWRIQATVAKYTDFSKDGKEGIDELIM